MNHRAVVARCLQPRKTEDTSLSTECTGRTCTFRNSLQNYRQLKFRHNNGISMGPPFSFQPPKSLSRFASQCNLFSSHKEQIDKNELEHQPRILTLVMMMWRKDNGNYENASIASIKKTSCGSLH